MCKKLLIYTDSPVPLASARLVEAENFDWHLFSLNESPYSPPCLLCKTGLLQLCSNEEMNIVPSQMTGVSYNIRYVFTKWYIHLYKESSISTSCCSIFVKGLYKTQRYTYKKNQSKCKSKNLPPIRSWLKIFFILGRL